VRRQRRVGPAVDTELKTARSRRIVPLPAIAVMALRRQRGERVPRPVDRIFPVAPSTLTQAWLRTIRRTGLPPMRLHDLRHGAATLMLAGGTPMRVIADTLGHSSPAVTANVYAHALPAAQRDAADRLDDALRGAG
jgi:integrase